MKKEGINKIKLGLFVTATLVLFILGIFFIGQKQGLFARTIKVKFTCSNVSGLQAGNKVRFSGIDVGTVTSVALTSDTQLTWKCRSIQNQKDLLKKMRRPASVPKG